MTRQVLVTGGSMGIGQACAQRLAAEGNRVIIAARGLEAIDETLASLEGEGHEGIQLDVADEASWQRVSAKLDQVGALVHAAAVIGPVGPIEALDPKQFSETIEINVVGAFLAIRSCGESIRERDGAMVLFSGGGATSPLPRFDAYACSKAAVARLVENVAADGVRINAVAPGMVATRMHDITLNSGPTVVGEEYFETTVEQVEKGGTPPELAAELVSFLLSSEAHGISGRIISAPWDHWSSEAFLAQLKEDPDLATLRRIDNQFFEKMR